MATALIYHDDCLDHVTPRGYPEQVARLDAVMTALEGMDLKRVTAPLAADDDILRAHPQSHVSAMKAAAPAEGWKAIDEDTYMSVGTLAAAYRACISTIKYVKIRVFCVTIIRI